MTLGQIPPTPPPPQLPEVPDGAAARPAPPGGPARWRAWTGLPALLVAFTLAAMGAVVIGIVAGLAGARLSGDTPSPSVTILATVAQDLALVVTAVGFAWLAGRPRPADFGLRRPGLLRAIGWTVALWFAFVVVSGVWALFLEDAFGIEQRDDLPTELGADESTVALVAVAVLVTVLAPIAEEVFFRGYFFAALRNWRGFWPAAIITGVVFGGIHAFSSPPAFLLPLALFGFALCALYQLTGSLLPCIALHALNNALAFGVSQDWAAGPVIALMGGALAGTMAIAVPLSAARAGPVAVRSA